MVDFFGGFDEPRAHRRAGDVFESAGGQRGFDFVEVLQRQGIELDAGGDSVLQDLRDGAIEVVAPPIGVDEVVADGAPPRLAAVDIGGNGDDAIGGDGESVRAAERAIEKIGIIVDVVDRGEKRLLDSVFGHRGAQGGDATGEFAVGKSVANALAVANDFCVFHCRRIFCEVEARFAPAESYDFRITTMCSRVIVCSVAPTALVGLFLDGILLFGIRRAKAASKRNPLSAK